MKVHIRIDVDDVREIESTVYVARMDVPFNDLIEEIRKFIQSNTEPRTAKGSLD